MWNELHAKESALLIQVFIKNRSHPGEKITFEQCYGQAEMIRDETAVYIIVIISVISKPEKSL
jgi:hypothetical protein